ncbi:hypothetical protein JCM5350_008132 [Sporobolomyces pararoseus]
MGYHGGSSPPRSAYPDQGGSGGSEHTRAADFELTQFEKQHPKENHPFELSRNQLETLEMLEMEEKDEMQGIELDEAEQLESGENELEEGEIVEDDKDLTAMSVDGSGQETSAIGNRDERKEIANSQANSSQRDCLFNTYPTKFHHRLPFASPPSEQPFDSNLEEDSTIYVYRFPVPSDGLVPLLIGKSGAVVKRIREETGAEIRYVESVKTPLSPLDPSLVPATGFIQGTIYSIRNALNLSKNYLLIRNLSYPVFLDFNPSYLEVRDQQNKISNFFRKDLNCDWGKKVNAQRRRSSHRAGAKAFGRNQWQQKARRSELLQEVDRSLPLPTSSDEIVDHQEQLLDDSGIDLTSTSEPADPSLVPSPPPDLRAYSPSATSDCPQRSLSPSPSTRSISPPSSPQAKRRRRSSSPSPARFSLDLTRSRPRKNPRSSPQEDRMQTEEALRAAAQATRPSKSEESNFEIPLVAATLFLGPASSLPHLERISGTKLKLESEALGARLTVIASTESRDKLEKLKMGIEDTVRSLKGYESWSLDQRESESSSNEPVSTDSVQQQYPSPVSLRSSNSPEATRSRSTRKADHGGRSRSKGGLVNRALSRAHDALSGYLPPPAEDFVSSRRSRKLSPEVEPPPFKIRAPPKSAPLPRCKESDSRSIFPLRLPSTDHPLPPRPSLQSHQPHQPAKSQPQAQHHFRRLSPLEYWRNERVVYKKRRLPER